MNNRGEVIVIIGCDVDPDRNPEGVKISSGEEIWDGVTKGISELKEMFSSFVSNDNPYPNITWLLRADEQMNKLYNDYAYPVRYFKGMWQSFHKDGDEIGWHPHLWDWSDEHEWWYPRLDDNKWTNTCLDNGYNAITKHFKITSVRTGWDFQSNFIMKKLNALGIIVDFSALPMQKVIAFESAPPPYRYDWRITTEEFYHPSTVDYRRKAKVGEKALKILEMPLSLTPITFTRAISKFLYHNYKHFSNKKLAGPLVSYSFHRKEIMRIAKDPLLFKPGVESKFKECKAENCTKYIITYFHPDELLRNDLFSIKNFGNNLKYISNMSKKYDVPYRFLTATDAANECLRKHH